MESEVGFLVGVHALASAVAAIPLVSATLAVNRKKLLWESGINVCFGQDSINDLW